MDKIELYLVKEYNSVSPPIQKIDSLIDNSIRDCYKNFFIDSNINLFTILNLQISLIMNQLISQFLIKSWVSMK